MVYRTTRRALGISPGGRVRRGAQTLDLWPRSRAARQRSTEHLIRPVSSWPPDSPSAWSGLISSTFATPAVELTERVVWTEMTYVTGGETGVGTRLLDCSRSESTGLHLRAYLRSSLRGRLPAGQHS